MDVVNQAWANRSFIRNMILTWNGRIPPLQRLQCLERVKEAASYMADDGVDEGGVLTFGCACSGTGIWHKGVEDVLDFWRDEFSLTLNTKNLFMTECDKKKQLFLKTQHAMGMLISNTSELASALATNQKTGKQQPVPWVNVFGAGFSCKGLSRQNRHHSTNIGTMRRGGVGEAGAGETWKTWEDVALYHKQRRPKLAFFENVEDIMRESEVADCDHKSDADYIKGHFHDNNFTAVDVVMHAPDWGSPAERTRWWCVVWDVPPHVGKALRIEQKFLSALRAMRCEPLPPTCALMSPTELEAICDSQPFGVDRPPAKRNTPDVGWKLVHEQLFLEHGYHWPPSTDLVGFRLREAELVWFSNLKFPATLVDEWEFFDSNHSAERTLRLGQNSDPSALRRPWQKRVPTLTAQSVIACRKKSADGTLVLRRLHGLEALRMAGWDMCHWADSDFFKDNSFSGEFYSDLAGNCWSLFHFVPLFLAAMGACSWGQVRQTQQAEASAEGRDGGGSQDGDESSSTAGAAD